MRHFGLLLVLVALAACSSSSKGRGIAVVDVSAAPALSSSIKELEITVSKGGSTVRTVTQPWTAGDGGTAEQIGVFIPGDVSGTVEVTIIGKNAEGQAIALAGPVQVTIEAGKASVAVTLVLMPWMPSPDGGPPLGTGGAGGSLATGGVGGKGSGGTSTGGTAQGGAGQGGTSTGGAAGGKAGSAATGGSAGGTTGVGGSAPARKWSTAVNMGDSTSADTLDSFDIAMGPVSGDAVLVWADLNGVNGLRYTAASNAWSTTRSKIETRGETREVHVGADGRGHFIAVWAQTPDAGQTDVKVGAFGSQSNDGITWATPTLLSEGAVWGDIRLAVSRNGVARAVWDQREDDTANARKVRSLFTAYFDGTSWGTGAHVKLGNDDYDRYARVGISDQGAGVIVWLDPDPTARKDSAYAASFTGATVAEPKLLESYDTDIIEYPDVAVNAGGAAIATWLQRVSASGDVRADVYAARLAAGGTAWSVPERFARPSFAGQLSPALDYAGGAYVAWSQPDASKRYQLTVSASTGPDVWTGTAAFETDNMARDYTNQDLSPVVRVANTSRDVLIGWQKRPSDLTFGPRVMWRAASGTYSAPVDLGTFDKLYGFGMRASVTDDGRAALVWSYHVAAKDQSPLTFLSRSEIPAASLPAIYGIYVSVYR